MISKPKRFIVKISLQYLSRYVIFFGDYIFSDGFTACGLFVVFSYIVEKYENELEIDVCNAIRLARRSGRSFVNRTVSGTSVLEMSAKTLTGSNYKLFSITFC